MKTGIQQARFILLAGVAGKHGLAADTLQGFIDTVNAKDSVELLLQIVPGPWNNASSGAYAVVIKARP